MSDYNLGTATGRIVVDGDGASKGFQVASNAAKAFGEAVKSAITDKLDDIQKLGDRLTKVGIAGSIGLAGAVKVAANFEQQMSAIKAVSGATADQMKNVSDEALRIGKDTSFSASEAGSAIEELVKAGVSLPDVLNGAADATVALAAAGGVDLPTAATLAANAMNQFGLSAKQMPRVADLIAGAANASAIDVDEFGRSLQQVGAVAHLVGTSFDDTAVAIAELGNAGIKSSDAGTSLKSFFTNLIPQTNEQITLMQKLGLITVNSATAFQTLANHGITPANNSLDAIVGAIEQYNQAMGGSKAGTQAAAQAAVKTAMNWNVLTNQFFDAGGAAKGLANQSQVLQDALAGMSKEQKLATLNTLFGSDAIRSAAILADNGADGFNKLAAAMGKVSAADVAKTRLDNFSGAMENLKGSIETAMITIGNVFLPIATAIVRTVQHLVDVFNVLPGPIKTMIAAFLGVGSAMSLFVGLAIKAAFVLTPMLAKMLLFRGIRLVVGSILDFGRALFTSGSLGTAGAAGLSRYQAAAAGIRTTVGRATIGAVASLGASLVLVGAQIAVAMEKAAPSIDKVTASLLQLNGASKVAGNLDQYFKSGGLRGFNDALKFITDPGLNQKINGVVVGLVTLGQSSGFAMDAAKKSFGSLDQALAQLVSGGNADAAKQKFADIATAAAGQGVSLDKLQKLFPQYADALAAVSNNTAIAGNGTDALSTSSTAAAGAVAKEQKAIDALKASLDSLNSANEGVGRAQIALKAAFDATKAAFKGNKDSLNLNTKAGRDHLTAVLDNIDAANEYAQQIANQTGSVEKGRKAFQDQIGVLRGVLSAAGLTKTQIDHLINTYAKVPKKVSTKLTADDYAALASIKSLQARLAAIKDKVVTVAVRVTGNTDKSAVAAAVGKQGGTRNPIRPGMESEVGNFSKQAYSDAGAKAALGFQTSLEGALRRGLAPAFAAAAKTHVTIYNDAVARAITSNSKKIAAAAALEHYIEPSKAGEIAAGFAKDYVDAWTGVLTDSADQIKNSSDSVVTSLQSAITTRAQERQDTINDLVDYNAQLKELQAERVKAEKDGAAAEAQALKDHNEKVTRIRQDIAHVKPGKNAANQIRNYNQDIQAENQRYAKQLASLKKSAKAEVAKFTTSMTDLQGKIKVDLAAIADFDSMSKVFRNAGASNKLIDFLHTQSAKLQGLADQREDLSKKIDKANDDLANAISARDSYNNQVAQAAFEFASLINAKAPELDQDAINSAQKAVDDQKNVLDQAQQNLNDAQSEFDIISARYGANARQTLAAQSALQTAQDAYNKAIADSTAAQGALDKAQRQSAVSASDIISEMQDRLNMIVAFNTKIAALRNSGLNGASLKQIVDAGVENGTAYADALLNGGQDAINQVNNLESQLNQAAGTLGYNTSQDFYQAGVNAAQGIVDGLNSQMATITASMTTIANSMIDAIKTALGIHSPSKEMYDVSIFTGQGLINGFKKIHPAVMKAWSAISDGITMATPAPNLALTQAATYGQTRPTAPLGAAVSAAASGGRQGDTINLTSVNGASASEIVQELSWNARVRSIGAR